VDDDLDDELRRLFSDDRLDVHVPSDATEAVVRGAGRRRRRRSAVASAFAVVTLVGAGVVLTQLPPPADNTAEELLPTSSSTSSATSTTPSPSTVFMTETKIVEAPTSGNPNNPDKPGNTANPTKPRTTTPPPAPPAESGRFGNLILGMSEADALKTGELIEPSSTTDPDAKCKAYSTNSVPDSDAVIISMAKGLVRITLPSYAKTGKNITVGSKVADVKAAYPTATQSGSTYLVQMAATPKWTYVFETDGTAVTTVRQRLVDHDCPSA
jgi:hypothetical protein